MSKGYDSDAIAEQARAQGMQAQIPSRKNRKVPREHDQHPYRHHHWVENAFLHLKQWRGIGKYLARAVRNTAGP